MFEADPKTKQIKKKTDPKTLFYQAANALRNDQVLRDAVHQYLMKEMLCLRAMGCDMTERGWPAEVTGDIGRISELLAERDAAYVNYGVMVKLLDGVPEIVGTFTPTVFKQSEQPSLQASP